MFLLTVYAVLLARYSGQFELTIGVPVANRTARELEPLIGFFVNNLPLDVDLSGDPPFLEALARVEAIALEAFQHQELSFEKLLDLAAADASERPSLFHVLFAHHHGRVDPPVLGGLRTEPVFVDLGRSLFDLALVFTRTSAGLHGKLEYSTELFDAATVERV